MNKLAQTITQATVVILLLGLGVTNPSSNEYKTYAADKISRELKDNTCTKLENNAESYLVKSCQILVSSIEPQIEITIKQNTKHSNWLIFSIYKTELQISSLIPKYCFTTIGIFDLFLTYQIEEM